jgi:hypothetical protein
MYSYIVYDENYTLKIYSKDPVHETPFLSLKRYLLFQHYVQKYSIGATSLEERFNLRYAQSLKSFEVRKDEKFFF